MARLIRNATRIYLLQADHCIRKHVYCPDERAPSVFLDKDLLGIVSPKIIQEGRGRFKHITILTVRIRTDRPKQIAQTRSDAADHIRNTVNSGIVQLTHITLGIFFSRRHNEIFFVFCQKKDLSFHCKLSPLGTICMKCQILFSGKNKKKNVTNLSSAENFIQSVKHLLHYS